MDQLQDERMLGRLNAYPTHSSYAAIRQKGADGDLFFSLLNGVLLSCFSLV